MPDLSENGINAEEGVKVGFAEQVRAGTVRFYFVDFEDPKNARLAKGYGIDEPALIVARISNHRVARFTNLTDIWTKVSDKPAFVKYVQEGVSAIRAPSDRVVAMYFHRTQRCPTCRKMGSYAEEAVNTKFANELQDGTVAFYDVDFQQPTNAPLAKRYQVEGPALIVANVKDNKVARFENLEEIWSRVADKEAFVSYVQGSIEKFREESAAIARK